MVDPTARVHPTADLEVNVVIRADTGVWHRAQIRRGARIGSDCVIGRDAFIDEGVSLGERVKVQNLALVCHGVTVEDGVLVGPNAILTNDRFPRSITATGELARADDWVVSEIRLAYGCSVDAGAVVVAGTDVARSATVGAGSVVTRGVPDHALVAGTRRGGWAGCAPADAGSSMATESRHRRTMWARPAALRAAPATGSMAFAAARSEGRTR